MPRPGPRPYVRRAWHSDRQQPIRGSLIQEIFRLANEVHCSTTRKNREWQEKLPNVVLKAEEIIYSKANSKDEYLDVNTLWDRVNDAINTIIRRDENTETGELLQPCIEAALHLGCTPRRSSRSQRNESPRYYLRPETLEATSVPAYISNSKVNGTHTTNSPFMIHCPPYLTPDIVNFLHPCLDAGNHSVQRRNYGDFKKFPVFSKKFAPSDAHHAPVRTPALSNTWSVYPLSYNNENLSDDPELSLRPSNSYVHLMESNELGRCQSFSPVKLGASDFISSSRHEGTSNRGQGIECDLTLRLGSLVVPCSGAHLHMENSNASS